MEEIGYTEGEKKITPPVINEKTEAYRDKAIESIEKKQAAEQVKQEMGISEPPKPADEMPADLPKFCFKCGSKMIGCPKFELDEKEAEILAHHMSILLGNVQSKYYSLIVILIVILYKVSECWEKIGSMFGKKKGNEPAGEPHYDDKKQTMGVIA